MVKKKIGSIFILIGFALIAIIFLADSFRISELMGYGESPGFGRNQIIGILVGIISVIIGWFLKREK